MMANMADGGKTPIRSGAELAEIGYALAIFPSITGLACGGGDGKGAANPQGGRHQRLA